MHFASLVPVRAACAVNGAGGESQVPLELARLAAALDQLPDDQRQAATLHHLEHYSVAETVQKMGRSKDAVAGLIFRGLHNLRDA